MNFTFNEKEVLLLLPMIILFITSLIPLMVKVLCGNKEPKGAVSLFIPLIGIILSLISTVVMGGFVGSGHYIFRESMVIDGITVLSFVIIQGILAISLMVSKEHVLNETKQASEYLFLLFNSVVGMMVVVASNDLILTFVGIEMMSLCLYMLIPLSKEVVYTKESAIKYFILGSFASAILLYGISFIYGSSGTTTLSSLPEVSATSLSEISATLASSNRLFLIGMGLVAIGFGFKVSMFPFHSWTPDVYQGASTPLTGFMATAVKAVSFVAFLRIIILGFLQGQYSASFVHSLEWLAVLTMFAGNVAALLQNNFKRMLAYSSVAHSGYIMIGIIAAGLPESKTLGSSGVIFYLFAYSIMTLGTFALLALFEKKENISISMDHFKGLAKKKPYLALGLTLLMLSLAGIPPTVGFFGKFFLFSSAIQAGLYWLAIWGVINSVISVYYYLRPVVLMYMYEADEEITLADTVYTKFAVGVAVVMVVIFGLFSDPVYQIVIKAL